MEQVFLGELILEVINQSIFFMNWYIVKMVFQIVNESLKLQFDEQIRLIEAEDESDAFNKSEIVGLQEEANFLSESGQMVNWKFKAITCIKPIKNLEHGTELWSSIFEKEPSERFLENIKLKNAEVAANRIFSNYSTQ